MPRPAEDDDVREIRLKMWRRKEDKPPSGLRRPLLQDLAQLFRVAVTKVEQGLGENDITGKRIVGQNPPLFRPGQGVKPGARA